MKFFTVIISNHSSPPTRASAGTGFIGDPLDAMVGHGAPTALPSSSGLTPPEIEYAVPFAADLSQVFGLPDILWFLKVTTDLIGSKGKVESGISDRSVKSSCK